MQDLQLIGVHENGEHLLLSGPDDARFQVPVDETLRAAIRRDRPRLGQLQIEVDGGLRPRDVQALIRAGASADEAAERAGWSVEKVHRYEGPILAEREHVAGLARKTRLRARSGVSSDGNTPTLSTRVAERLKGRGVDAEDASWDSWRAEGGPWTVVLTFAAGGRQRQASWSFDLADKTLLAIDDEARWLSEEVQATNGPIPAPQRGSAAVRATAVYDLEAEGGLRPSAPSGHQDDPLDLMTAMRKRSTARGRRASGGHRASPKTASPVTPAGDRDDKTRKAFVQALPLEDLAAAGVIEHTGDAFAHGHIAGGGIARGDTASDGMSAGETDESIESEGTYESVETSAALSKSTVPTEQPPPREASRKPGRPSVPAWDEIMFGSRPGANRSSS